MARMARKVWSAVRFPMPAVPAEVDAPLGDARLEWMA